MFSKHAHKRNQQRCIPPIVHLWLSKYGEERFDKHGGIKRYFSSKSKKMMEKELGRNFIQENKKYLKAYCIENHSGSVITCGWITKRINYNK